MKLKQYFAPLVGLLVAGAFAAPFANAQSPSRTSPPARVSNQELCKNLPQLQWEDVFVVPSNATAKQRRDFQHLLSIEKGSTQSYSVTQEGGKTIVIQTNWGEYQARKIANATIARAIVAKFNAINSFCLFNPNPVKANEQLVIVADGKG